MIALALAALALGGDPSVHPWPIGPGPRYRPPAAKLDGRPVGGLECAPRKTIFQAHVELFVNRRVVVIPAGIGRSEGCDYPVRTELPIGVVEVPVGTNATIGDLFRLWGQPLGPRHIASFRSRQPVRAYIGGKLVRGAVSRVRLEPHAEIVLELGAYLAPHRAFLFPPVTP